MKLIAKTLILGLVLAGGVAYAEGERTDPAAKARSDLMRMVGKNTGILGDMAGGKSAFDAAAAASAKAALTEAAGAINATFEVQGAEDPASEAAPAIWTGWEDFAKKSDALVAAAGAIDVASLEGIQAGMGAIGGTCKDCHTTYRVKK
jgi:cytochrome c556